jgi:hypothetical protein
MEQRDGVHFNMAISEFEPDDRTMTRGWEPPDRTMTAYEVVCTCLVYAFSLLTFVSHWHIFRLITLVFVPAILILLLFRLCLPPRFSLKRLIILTSFLCISWVLLAPNFFSW